MKQIMVLVAVLAATGVTVGGVNASSPETDPIVVSIDSGPARTPGDPTIFVPCPKKGRAGVSTRRAFTERQPGAHMRMTPKIRRSADTVGNIFGATTAYLFIALMVAVMVAETYLAFIRAYS